MLKHFIISEQMLHNYAAYALPSRCNRTRQDLIAKKTYAYSQAN